MPAARWWLMRRVQCSQGKHAKDPWTVVQIQHIMYKYSWGHLVGHAATIVPRPTSCPLTDAKRRITVCQILWDQASWSSKYLVTPMREHAGRYTTILQGTAAKDPQLALPWRAPLYRFALHTYYFAFQRRKGLHPGHLVAAGARRLPWTWLGQKACRPHWQPLGAWAWLAAGQTAAASTRHPAAPACSCGSKYLQELGKHLQHAPSYAEMRARI